MIRNVRKSKIFVYLLILLFFFLITSDGWSVKIDHCKENDGKPVVRVKRGGKKIPAHQVERFEELFAEGKRLMQEEFDYEGAIQKFAEALGYAALIKQKSDVYFYLSLAYYATLEDTNQDKFLDTIEKLIEVDYYRELDESLCPRKYMERFQEIKSGYGVMRILSRPSGADVFLNESRSSSGKTPLILGHRAGDVKIEVKKGNKKKEDTVQVKAEQETAPPEYILKGGGSSMLLILGGAAAVGGIALAVLGGGGGGNGGGNGGPTTGSIQVNSSPTGAQIFLDGMNTGKMTNATLTNVSPGSHTIRLVLDNYKDHEESISVTAGQTATLSVTLTKHTITVTNPTSESKWVKGQSIDIEWEVDRLGVNCASTEAKSRSDSRLDRNLLSSAKDRILRSGINFRNLKLRRTNAVESVSFGNEANESVNSLRQSHELGSRSSKERTQRLSSNENPFNLDKRAPHFFPFLRSPSHQSSQPNALNSDVRPLGIDRIKIELYKGGGLEMTIAEETSNDGKHPWTVVDSLEYGSDYKVRVLSASDSSLYGESGEFKITIEEYEFVTKWGSQGNRDGQFNLPCGVQVQSSVYVYVADTDNNRIQKFTTFGDFTMKWGSYGTGNGQFKGPIDIAIDNSGYIYVIDYYNNRLQKFTSSGAFVDMWGSLGTENGQFKYPNGVAVDDSGYLYVADSENNRIQKFNSRGSFVTKWGSYGTGDGQFRGPVGVAVDSSGYVYVTDMLNDRIQKFTSSGSFVTKWGSPGTGDGQFNHPIGIAVDSFGFVYTIDSLNARVQKFNSSGSFITKWGSPGSADGQFREPRRLAVDNKGFVYVAERNNNRIQKFRRIE